MKTLILFLIPFLGFTQIKIQGIEHKLTIVGEARRGEEMLCRVSYDPTANDTIILILFRNEDSKSGSIEGLGYEGGKKEINFLKKSMLSVATKEKDYQLKLKLGEDNVAIINMREAGIDLIWLVTIKGYVALSKQDINMIFENL